MVDENRAVHTIAGTGRQGFHGDGGPAIEAALNNPSSVILDREGHILISDTNNHRIRILRGWFATH
jgi:hypothetical protein